ncbi:hypothetical protein [Paenibacillus woosongensis]|uniref:Uncharacterized protein n=1 Tax=Paenibacillus woosongensis TaxID=307580 RepID=A0ABQ4ML32_9BACL|nr:hypothetical protein [Paenibacillus woosongensis]GIP56691.1 hypothetical protein J15TS10_05050 [Paenibacillus woosongensis]
MKKIRIGAIVVSLIIVLFLGISLFLACRSNGVSSLNLHEIRKIAWKSVEKNQYDTITIKWEEARVELIESKDKWIIPITDEQKKKLEQIKKTDSILIAVTFNTEQDGLLGPIVPIIDPKTMEVVGFYPRY